MGRTVTSSENYQDGVVINTDDKTTDYSYNSAGMTSLTTHLHGGWGAEHRVSGRRFADNG